jgi:glycosyltransferase involved in cell wall biosynthesis
LKTPASVSSDPLVSVAMITFNHRPYIDQAVRSVLAQTTDFPFELVIGEDCSTDGTRERVVSLSRQEAAKIRLITSESNVGMHANSARTLAGCRGKYLAFCEGDDFWHDPTKLTRQVAMMEQQPQYSIVHSHCHRFWVHQQKLQRNSLRVPYSLDEHCGYEDILSGRRPVMTLTVMARAEKLRTVLASCPECTDPKWPMGDTQMWLELSRLGSVGCIHESLATKNMLRESASSSDNPMKILSFFLAARRLHLHYLRKYPVSAEVERCVRRKQALALLRHAYKATAPSVAEEMYLELVSTSGNRDFRSKCLLWGSRSRARKILIRPLIFMQASMGRFSEKVKRLSEKNK